MRTTRASRRERLLQLWERNVLASTSAGLTRIRVEDHTLRGDTVTVEGRELVNFGSCAYLGLNLDQRLKDAAIDAIDRYGPVFSSSTAYTSAPLYGELEELLEAIFGAAVVIPSTTTLGHLAVLPVLVESGDAIVIDAQAHASVHLAAQTLMAEGITVEAVPHGDPPAAESAIERLATDHDRVWFLADGVYSMGGDTLDVPHLVTMLDRFPTMRAYIDDAHGFGWQGPHGAGHVLSHTKLHPRMILAVSLAKSFGSGGSALVFPDPDEARRVQLCAGTLTFSGPLHPAELGAAVASARIHLSEERDQLAAALIAQIGHLRRSAGAFGVPLVSQDESPIWFVKVGGAREAIEVASAMSEAGYYLNVSFFPAVPVGEAGLRFTNTLYLDDQRIEEMLDVLGRSVSRLERRTIDLTRLEETG